MSRPLRLSVAFVACCLLFAAFAVAGAGAESASFFSTGAEQTFQVPLGVTSLHVVAVGAPGGTGTGGFVKSPGGMGAVVTGDLAVSAGQVLYVEVGAPGIDGSALELGGEGGAAFNGGGAPGSSAGFEAAGAGGGGASDVRTIPLVQSGTLPSRLQVAAGGGGSGGNDGAAGGNAGEGGEDGFSGAGGGDGGTATDGGKSGGGSGDGGSLGAGGKGGLGGSGGGGGGGGGGGLFGGGGGEQGISGGAGAGGGGGSSSGGQVSADASGKPSITITYQAFIGPPTSTPDGGGGGGGTSGSGAGGGTAATAPETTLDGHPPKIVVTKKSKASVRFRFSANVVRPSFFCKIDAKPFSACTSPKRYKVAPGSHTFKVKAVKGATVDPSPATFVFKVRRSS